MSIDVKIKGIGEQVDLAGAQRHWSHGAQRWQRIADWQPTRQWLAAATVQPPGRTPARSCMIALGPLAAWLGLSHCPRTPHRLPEKHGNSQRWEQETCVCNNHIRIRRTHAGMASTRLSLTPSASCSLAGLPCCPKTPYMHLEGVQ